MTIKAPPATRMITAISSGCVASAVRRSPWARHDERRSLPCFPHPGARCSWARPTRGRRMPSEQSQAFQSQPTAREEAPRGGSSLTAAARGLFSCPQGDAPHQTKPMHRPHHPPDTPRAGPPSLAGPPLAGETPDRANPDKGGQRLFGAMGTRRAGPWLTMPWRSGRTRWSSPRRSTRP
jgi:hypothetical protein